MKRLIPFLFWILASCTAIQPGQNNQSEAASKPQIPGKTIAFSRDKGNCLACHEIEDGEFPGNIGPPLKNLSGRFKNKQQLREQVWDPTRFNAETSMPPFGKHKILTEQEIDELVDYLWGL